uniref:Ground-like domain-containing protein n=1 Tax=Ditylenchus dipsaci TaxID=166011 RepID=A0A915DU45_9BILA
MKILSNRLPTANGWVGVDNSVMNTTTSPRRANIRRREERQKSLLQMPEDPRCNSKVLHKIMVENINDDVRQSKLAIVHAAESILGGTFSVICSKAHFSYIASTRLFCLVVKRVKCFAFLADYPIYERPRRIGTVQTS